MFITDDKSIKHADLSPALQTPGHLQSNTDIGFFSSQLERPTSTKAITANPGTSNLLIAASEQLDTTHSRITRQLRTLSKDVNREVMKKFPTELSNTLFMSQMLVKSLGKTTQCIDKICNLQ